MILFTGDFHADFTRLSMKNFPKQKELTENDYLICCGDFGIWDGSKEEKYWLKWLSKKKYKILFVDGNHENFDRLNNCFKAIEFCGGIADKIADNIYHLRRGYIYTIDGKKIFAFGGARSHDIQDGILEISNYNNTHELVKDYNRLTKQGKLVRIKGLSWWEEEMPNEEEFSRGLENLLKQSNKVDYIVSHCCPNKIVYNQINPSYKPDELTEYFDRIMNTVDYNRWFFGHYHRDCIIDDKHTLLYHRITDENNLLWR